MKKTFFLAGALLIGFVGNSAYASVIKINVKNNCTLGTTVQYNSCKLENIGHCLKKNFHDERKGVKSGETITFEQTLEDAKYQIAVVDFWMINTLKRDTLACGVKMKGQTAEYNVEFNQNGKDITTCRMACPSNMIALDKDAMFGN